MWRKNYLLSKKSENFNAKLAPKYSGPFEIRRIISLVIIDLRAKRGKWLKHIHVQDLKSAVEETNNNQDDDMTTNNNTDNEEDER